MPSFLVNTSGRCSTKLVSHTSDWGVSVSQANADKTAGMKGLAVVGYLTLFAASLFVIPIMVGLSMFETTSKVAADLAIVVGCVGLAMFFNAQSRKGPKNALQIDYDASEVRLGSVSAKGAFVRHKVCPLRSLDSVVVNASDPSAPTLTLEIFSEAATIRFSNTDIDALQELAATIQTAADEARAAPIRSRIVSRINGFEAGMREIGQRVRSRVTSSFA